MYNSWKDKLSQLEYAAVRRYTGSDYEDINDALRITGLSNARADIRQCVQANIRREAAAAAWYPPLPGLAQLRMASITAR